MLISHWIHSEPPTNHSNWLRVIIKKRPFPAKPLYIQTFCSWTSDVLQNTMGSPLFKKSSKGSGNQRKSQGSKPAIPEVTNESRTPQILPILNQEQGQRDSPQPPNAKNQEQELHNSNAQSNNPAIRDPIPAIPSYLSACSASLARRTTFSLSFIFFTSQQWICLQRLLLFFPSSPS